MRDTILKLLAAADNFAKYGKVRHRAMAKVREARELALESGLDDLVRLATLRMADLDRAELNDTLTDIVPAPDVSTEPAPEDSADMRRAAGRVPPEQTVTRNWPVLHVGAVPEIAGGLRVWGTVRTELGLSREALAAIGETTMMSDFHCVTGWSRLDNTWTGVWCRDVLARAGIERHASHVVAHAPDYAANVPLELLVDEGFCAWAHDGRPLEPEHGGPLRLVVPSRYGWKSVKWLTGLEVTAQDRPGYWEVRGYHNRADPWLEERFA